MPRKRAPAVPVMSTSDERPATLLVVGPCVFNGGQTAPHPRPDVDSSALVAGFRRAARMRLFREAAARADVESMLLLPSTVRTDPPGTAPGVGGIPDGLFRRVLRAPEVASADRVFSRTLLVLAEAVDARSRELADAGSAGVLSVVWMSKSVENEYCRAHAQDVLAEYTSNVVLVGVDASAGATLGDLGVVRRALGGPMLGAASA